MGLESHCLSFAVLVCGMPSPLVQTTAVPGATLIVGGAKAKFAIFTPPPTPISAGDACAAGAVGAAGAWSGAVVAFGTTASGADPDWRTIFRGALPMGIVASTFCFSTSTTETVLAPSLVSYAVFFSDVVACQCGDLPSAS